MQEYFLYILYSGTIDQYYVGISHNPEMRISYHNSSNKGWTKRGRPWELVFLKIFPNRVKAQKWENWIKKQRSRILIKKIIKNQFSWDKI